MKARLVTAAAAAALFLCACGGGGGGGSKGPGPGPTTGPTVTYPGSTAFVALTASTNHASFARNVLSAARSLHTMADVIPGTAEGYFGPRNVFPSSLTLPCPQGGSHGWSVSRASASASAATPGDFVELRESACATGEYTTHGTIRVTLDATTANDFVATPSSITASHSFAVTAAWNDSATVYRSTNQWIGGDGTFDVSFDANVSSGTITTQTSTAEDLAVSTITVTSGLRITPRGGQAAARQSYTRAFTGLGTASPQPAYETWSADGHVCTTTLGGCIDVVVDPPLRFDLVSGLLPYAAIVSTNPTSGVVRGSDGQGNWLTIAPVNPDTGECLLSWSIGGVPGTEQCYWNAL